MLRLEKFTIEDRKDYEALAFNEAAMRMNMGRVFTAQEAETFFAMVLNCNRVGGTTGFYRVCCRDGTHWTYIGMGALSENEEEGALEIEYMLLPQFWHRGYGTEIAKELLSFGFSVLGKERIQARYILGNRTSLHVMEKCGMRFEGVFRHLLYVKGAFRDIGVCSILREEFFSANKKRVYRLALPHWYDRFH